LNPQRRTKLIKLALVAIVIDVVTSLFEIPFLAFTVGTITLEEIVEQIISSLIARNEINLTVIDRVIGMLPIPGITPVTVAVVRELIKK
jgi:hypothetical protein